MIVVLFKSLASETVDAKEYGKLGQRLGEPPRCRASCRWTSSTTSAVRP